ncbi:NAD(P)/FAD-dependent oxidoreductase [Parvibium lacunae]|uniref:FAD-binding protein n=1 Tax=Parvibium lacunae TaxID=1888893 RepID=A0A368L7E2_9BURK|nr:NAD(P)-binding protein [Parvibium lacunae]RCS59534.1 FAD-binding protein [Parvibium lacunae]
MRKKIIVIGAGLAGAVCAQTLHAAGHQVVVLEKARGVGGRMSTRRISTELSGLGLVPVTFDHGAQYFRARHPEFQRRVALAQQQGLVAPWAARHGKVEGAGNLEPLTPDNTEPAARWVAVPDMPNWIRSLLNPMTVRVNTRAAALTMERSAAGELSWTVQDEQGATLETADAVVLAMPPAQAAVLCAPYQPTWANHLTQWPMDPCWTWMALTDEIKIAPSDIHRKGWASVDSVQLLDHPLAWVARNHHKPSRQLAKGKEAWVVQASPAWTTAHLDLPAAEAASAMQGLWRDLLGPAAREVTVHYQAAHRWLYARAGLPAAALPAELQQAAWVDEKLGLACCGDYLGYAHLALHAQPEAPPAALARGSRIEDAWWSGWQCAQQYLAAWGQA